MGGAGCARLIANREELLGGITGATLTTTEEGPRGGSGIGQVGGGVGAARESSAAKPGLTRVQFLPPLR